MSGNRGNEITVIREVTVRERLPTGQVVEVPTGDLRVVLAGGRSVTYSPSRMRVPDLAVGRTLRESNVQKGRVSGRRVPRDMRRQP